MALVGNEVLYVNGVSQTGDLAATLTPTTTGAIAALADLSTNPPVVNTAISTVGAGTLTAAGLVGGIITRTGPVAAYTDTTATAVQIVAALAAYVEGSTFFVYIRNNTAFTQTLAAGSGVTITGTLIVPPNSEGTYLMTIVSETAVTLFQVATVPLTTKALEVITTLSTVGAGTITAAGIAGGVTSRTGSQSGTPFTDTTATADLIIAAQPNVRVGDSWEYTYQNTTNAVATLTGGTGVTVSGITTVNAGDSARYLVTYTAASTVTMVGFMAAQSSSASDPSVVLAGSTSGTTTLIASAVAGSTVQTFPAVTGVVASTTGANLYVADLKRTSASVTKNASDVYANVTGLSFTVVPGTYAVRAYLPSTVASGTGGIKYAFNYTTAVITSMQVTGTGYTASAVAVQQTTTTTTQTDLFTQAAVVILTEIKGTMVVGTGGTIDIQMAQNTSNASDTIALIGGYAEFVRIA